MKITELLERRKQFPLGSKTANVNEFDYITTELERDEDVVGLVLPVSFLNRKHRDIATLKELIFEDWNLLGICDLSRAWMPYSGIDFNLICLGKKKPKDVFFTKYDGEDTFTRTKGKQSKNGEIGEQVITDEYSMYLDELQRIIDDTANEFNKSKASAFHTSSNSINPDHLSIHYYHPDLVNNQAKLDQEKAKALSELADIIMPRMLRDEQGKLLSPANFQYPLDVDSVKERDRSNIILKKGDILMSSVGNSKVFLINEKPSVELYASPHTFVIRCLAKSISPEYLFLYLKSDTASKYVLRHQMGAVIKRVSKKQVDMLPVIIPSKSVVERSAVLFQTLFENPKEDTISVINSELFSKKSPKKPIQFEFIEEYIQKSQKHKMVLIKAIVAEDLKEIKQCLDVGANKSAIILAGSVLEAILIDWLSEIDQKNYVMSKIDISLMDMIKQMDRMGVFDRKAVDAAHSIRKQRNLVHPKKYLNSGSKIDKKTAMKTINELKSILGKRL